MTQIELIPCPFCEGPPVPFLRNAIAGGPLITAGIPEETPIAGQGWAADAHIFCHECGAQGPGVHDRVFTKQQCQALTMRAAELWNKRTARNRSLFDHGARDGLNRLPRGAGQFDKQGRSA